MLRHHAFARFLFHCDCCWMQSSAKFSIWTLGTVGGAALLILVGQGEPGVLAHL